MTLHKAFLSLIGPLAELYRFGGTADPTSLVPEGHTQKAPIFKIAGSLPHIFGQSLPNICFVCAIFCSILSVRHICKLHSTIRHQPTHPSASVPCLVALL